MTGVRGTCVGFLWYWTGPALYGCAIFGGDRDRAVAGTRQVRGGGRGQRWWGMWFDANTMIVPNHSLVAGYMLVRQRHSRIWRQAKTKRILHRWVAGSLALPTKLLDPMWIIIFFICQIQSLITMRKILFSPYLFSLREGFEVNLLYLDNAELKKKKKEEKVKTGIERADCSPKPLYG